MGLGGTLIKGMLVFGAVATPLSLISSSVEKHEHNKDIKMRKIEAEKELRQQELRMKASAYNKYTDMNISANQKKSTSQCADEYEYDFLCAKAAVCSYIIWADGVISREEQNEINAFLESIAVYGYSSNKITRIREIFKKITSFLVVENYLRKVKTEDLDMLGYFAEELANVDYEITPAEAQAVKKVCDYIAKRKGVVPPPLSHTQTRTSHTQTSSSSRNKKPIMQKCSYCKHKYYIFDEDLFCVCPTCRREKFVVVDGKAQKNRKAPDFPSLPIDPFSSNEADYCFSPEQGSKYFSEIEKYKKQYFKYLKYVHNI